MGLGREALETLHPGTTYMLDEEFWYRCLMQESLAVWELTRSRASIGPRGGCSMFLRAPATTRPRPVSIEVDKLMIWVPVQCAVDIGRCLADTASNVSAKYSVEGHVKVGKHFSYYSVHMRKRFVALEPMQPSFPSLGHLFRAGALLQIVAKNFVRTVYVKFEVKLPIYSPSLEQFKGDTPPCNLLPDNWVFNGEQGRSIGDELMAIIGEVHFRNKCLQAFYKREHSPLRFDVKHGGFKDMRRVSGNCFHEDPLKLWQGSFLSTWSDRAAPNMPRLDDSRVAQAYKDAAAEMTPPLPTAAGKVVLSADEAESSDEGDGAAAAHPPRRTASARARGSKRK